MRNLIARAAGSLLALAVLLLLSVPAVGAQGNTANLYKSRCASCHGADGTGNTSVGKVLHVHNFRSPEIQKMTEAELTEIIAKGKAKMPKYEGKLKESEIKALGAFVHDLSHKK